MIQAAVTLFKENGFHKTTTRALAKQSGFSIGTLYEYIGSKEDILFLVCDAVYDEVIDKWERSIDENLTGYERLRQVIESYIYLMDELQDEVLVLYQESKSLPDEARAYVLEKELKMKRRLEQEIEQCTPGNIYSDKERELLCHNILVTGHMWSFRRWALASQMTIDEYVKLQVKQLLARFHDIESPF
nr:TetR/AcrR family transcriptional regulator [Texcoconibacillus texcoconensis]